MGKKVELSTTVRGSTRHAIHLYGSLAQSQIVVGGEDPGLVAAIALKVRFVSKHQGAHDRMQPISPHQQVEAAGAAPLKGHIDAFLVLLERLDGVPEPVLHLVLRELVERLGEIAPHDLYSAWVEGLAQSLQVDSEDAPMAFVDKGDLPKVCLLLLQTRPDPHELGDLHGLMSNVNRVPAFSQLWRALDHGRGETIALEPIRQARPSNTRSC